jgi:hypothetical protein
MGSILMGPSANPFFNAQTENSREPHSIHLDLQYQNPNNAGFGIFVLGALAPPQAKPTAHRNQVVDRRF